MSHSHHIWITRTVTCPFQTPLLTLLYFGNVYFLSDIKSGKIFFSLSWIRIASLSGTLSKFCFPSQEKLLIENQVAGKKKATSNNTCWVTFPTPAVFHLFVFCRYLSDFAIVRHFSTFPSCRHEVVDQRSNFSRDSSIMLESPSKWQIAVMLWSTYCTSLTKSTYQLIQMWGNEDMIWWLIKILSQLLWSMVTGQPIAYEWLPVSGDSNIFAGKWKYDVDGKVNYVGRELDSKVDIWQYLARGEKFLEWGRLVTLRRCCHTVRLAQLVRFPNPLAYFGSQAGTLSWHNLLLISYRCQISLLSCQRLL